MQNEEEKQRRVLAGITDSLVDAQRDLEAKKKYVRRASALPLYFPLLTLLVPGS